MKVLNIMLLAAATVVLLVGCTKNPLNYVPEDADFVVYFNLEGALDSKVLKILEGNETFSAAISAAILEEYMTLNFPYFPDFAGKAVCWGRFRKKSPEIYFEAVEAVEVTETSLPQKKHPDRKWMVRERPVVDDGMEPEFYGMVIVLNEDNAKKIFKNFRNHFEYGGPWTVTKDDIDDHEALIITYPDTKGMTRYVGGIVLVSDRELHITWGREPEIFEKSDASEIAAAIDSSAVIAVATHGDALHDLIGKKIDMDGRIIKGELFFSKNEITLKASADISELK